MAKRKTGNSRSEVIQKIADGAQVPREKVTAVLDALSVEVEKAIGPKGSGEFVVPGLYKVVAVEKATKQSALRRPSPNESVVKEDESSDLVRYNAMLRNKSPAKSSRPNNPLIRTRITFSYRDDVPVRSQRGLELRLMRRLEAEGDFVRVTEDI